MDGTFVFIPSGTLSFYCNGGVNRGVSESVLFGSGVWNCLKRQERSFPSVTRISDLVFPLFFVSTKKRTGDGEVARPFRLQRNGVSEGPWTRTEVPLRAPLRVTLPSSGTDTRLIPDNENTISSFVYGLGFPRHAPETGYPRRPVVPGG